MKSNVLGSFFSSSSRTTATLLACTLGLLMTIGALNGGVALTASVWDGLTTTLRDMLTSTWVLALAFVALVVAVWQLAHGRGYTYLAVVLGLLAVALIGPTFVTTMATSTRSVDHQTVAQAALQR